MANFSNESSGDSQRVSSSNARNSEQSKFKLSSLISENTELFDQVKQHQKYHTRIGSYLAAIPFLFGITFCWSKGPTVFFILSVLEHVFHISTNIFIKNFVTNLRHFTYVNMGRNVVVGSLQIFCQVWYGPTLPLHIFTVYKVLISTVTFYFNSRLSLMSASIFVTFNAAALIVSYLMNYDLLTIVEREYFPFRLLEMVVVLYSVFIGSLLFSIFITEKNKQYTAQTIEATKEKIISSEKTKYIASLSHEARNPLHAISGSISVFKHNIQSETCSNGCKHCYVNNESIAELIEDLQENTTLLEHIFSSSLQVSSLEMGKVELKVEDTNMLCLIESIASVFCQLAKTEQLSLHSYFNVLKVPIFLRADSVRLSQVVINLVSNAIKYTDRGYIKLICDAMNEREIHKYFPEKNMEEYEFIKIECIDTGKGIDEAQMNNLFKPYHVVELGQRSVDNYVAQTEKMAEFKDIKRASMLINTSRSNGLGLSICKLIVEKMEGDILVTSSSNGTNMTIFLPLRKVKPEILKNELVQKNNNYLTCSKIFEILNAENERLNIFIIDKDRFFRDVMLSYWKMFKRAAYINAEYETSSEFCEATSDKEIMQHTTVIFCPESEIEHIESSFKHGRVVLIPTIIRGSHRQCVKRVYLSKPVKFIDLLEFVYEHILDRSPLSTHRQSVVEIEKIPKIMKTKSVPVIDEFKSEKKVLIVDDNHLNLKILDKLLRILGFVDIDTANDGMDCFNKYKKKNYDIILLDCIMPILSGKESCELIRNTEKQENHNFRVPILAITANVWEDRESLIAQGFDSVVYKPIQIETLQTEIMSLLER